MITCTRLNGDEIVINAGLIEFVEATPDTMISLSTGRKLMIRESVEEVVDRVADYEGTVCSQIARHGRRQRVKPPDTDEEEDD